MKEVTTTETLPVPIDQAWSLISSVTEYPKIMPFTHAIKTSDKELRTGSWWSDITTILWIPMHMTHHIYVFEKPHTLKQRINLPFGGVLDEHFSLQPHGKHTLLFVTVQFHPGKIPFAHLILSVWEMRMRYLVRTAMKNFRGYCEQLT